jgi:hypothetical protein
MNTLVMNTLMTAALMTAQTTGSPAQKTTGYPECDKFIQMVSECIRTKVPPSARAEEQQRLDAFQAALGFVAGPALAEQCAENIRLEMRRDRYGCYAAQAAKAGVQTPCSLVTRAELEQILATSYSEGQHSGSKCMFATTGGSARPVTIEVRWTGGREELEGARIAQKAVDPRTSTGRSVVRGKTVAGLGDDAFLIVAGFMPMLYVRKGDAAVSVMAPATEEQLTAIARKALERLPR